MKRQFRTDITENSGHTHMQWILASIANLCTFIYGVDVGWISPMAKILQSELSPLGYAMSDGTLSWVASSTSFAASFGVVIFSYLADKYGRKLSIYAILLLQLISCLLRIFSPTLAALLISRIIAGLAAGGCFILVPMYVKEISQQSLTGILVTLQVFYQNVGILAMYVIGIYVEYYTILWMESVLPIIGMALMLKAPESPAFLVKNENIDRARIVVASLRGLECDDKIIENEVDSMVKQDELFKTMPDVSLVAIFKDKAWRRGLIVTLILFTIQAWNGAYAIITYASPILASTGVEFNVSPEVQSLSFPVVMISASFLLTLVVERFGRRTLLTATFLASAIALLMLSSAMIVLLYGGTVPSWIPVVLMMLSAAMYSGGICPLTYVVTTEMFIFQIRAKVMGILCSYAWVAFFIPLIVYSPLANAFGQHVTFLCFGLMNVLGVVFTLVAIPETRGKSDEEIRKALTPTKK